MYVCARYSTDDVLEMVLVVERLEMREGVSVDERLEMRREFQSLNVTQLTNIQIIILLRCGLLQRIKGIKKNMLVRNGFRECISVSIKFTFI